MVPHLSSPFDPAPPKAADHTAALGSKASAPFQGAHRIPSAPRPHTIAIAAVHGMQRLSCFVYPVLQLRTVHDPFVQVDLPLVIDCEQTTPQLPQLDASLLVLTQRPPQRSGEEVEQPETQVPMPLAMEQIGALPLHAWPQRPQFRSEVRAVSQSGWSSQFPYPALQMVAVQRRSGPQNDVPFATAHEMPQPPQLLPVSREVSHPSRGSPLQSA